ncbi:MAG: polyprenyl synthetase family protein [Actinomycetota bacterium]
MPRYPDDIRELVEEALETFFPPADTYPEIIYRAMRYSLFAGGKRFRPILTILAAEACGAEGESVMPTACAIEYIHTYSLIHDDLPAIDNDDLRRGLPTCHRKFSEDIAILAGDALFAEAFALVSRLQKASEQRSIIKTINELAEAAGPGGMVGGQFVDMESTGRHVDLDTVLYIHTHKTGRLIRASVRAGAILAGAGDKDLNALTEYGNHLGLAFQITDDILDETGSVEELGKRPGQDRAKHKATYPAVAGLDAARQKAAEEAKAAVAAVEDIDLETGPLRNLAAFVVERTG